MVTSREVDFLEEISNLRSKGVITPFIRLGGGLVIQYKSNASFSSATEYVWPAVRQNTYGGGQLGRNRRW